MFLEVFFFVFRVTNLDHLNNYRACVREILYIQWKYLLEFVWKCDIFWAEVGCVFRRWKFDIIFCHASSETVF